MSAQTQDDLAFGGQWRRDGLILRPIGITAEDRFGDVAREWRLAEARANARMQRLLAELRPALEAVADEHGRVDVFELAAHLRDAS